MVTQAQIEAAWQHYLSVDPQTWGISDMKAALEAAVKAAPPLPKGLLPVTPAEIEMMMEDVEHHRAGTVQRTPDGYLRTYYGGFNLTTLAEHVYRELSQRPIAPPPPQEIAGLIEEADSLLSKTAGHHAQLIGRLRDALRALAQENERLLEHCRVDGFMLTNANERIGELEAERDAIQALNKSLLAHNGELIRELGAAKEKGEVITSGEIAASER
jgi:hypothetical protein